MNILTKESWQVICKNLKLSDKLNLLVVSKDIRKKILRTYMFTCMSIKSNKNFHKLINFLQIHNFHSVKSLTLCGGTNLTIPSVSQFTNFNQLTRLSITLKNNGNVLKLFHNAKLTHLYIFTYNNTDISQIKDFLKTQYNLESFLYNSSNNNLKNYEELFGYILQNKNLQSFAFPYMENENAYKSLVNNCVDLKNISFFINGTTNVVSQSIIQILLIPKLKTLVLSRHHNYLNLKSLSNCKELEVLTCTIYNNDDIKLLTLNCTKLKRLNFNHLSQINDETVKIISENCEYLERLSLKGNNITDKSIEYFNNIKQLTSLSVRIIGDINNGFNCKNLKNLYLTGRNINNQNIMDLSKNCKRLTTISIRMTKITDEGVTMLLLNLQNLKYLRLGNNKLLNGSFIKYVNTSIISLNYFKYSHDVDEEDIINGIKKLPNIENFTLRGANISDDTIKILSEHCKKLTYLDIQYCHKLTIKSKKYLNTIKTLRRISSTNDTFNNIFFTQMRKRFFGI